jgi:hypothetical protein
MKTYPDSFVSANILLRIQSFTRPHVSVFDRPPARIRENDANTLESLQENALSDAMTPQCCCTCYNSGEKSKSSQGKSKNDPFVLTNDKVDILLSVILAIE